MQNVLANTSVLAGSGEPIEERNLVEFRLLYEGHLLASTNKKGRTAEKHAIRRTFHPQLRRLWHMNNNLRQLATNKSGDLTEPPATDFGGLSKDEYFFQRGLRAIGKNWSRAGYELVPLVTPDMPLRCSLDILLLRPEGKQYIYTMGDIDGQLKTLFDGLKIPGNEEATGKSPPQRDEIPFFCLLQDDSLITEVHVTTDQLLLLPNHKEVKASDAFVVIDVKLNHKDARFFDNYFG